MTKYFMAMLLSCFITSSALAAGMFLSPSGVGALGRAGAVVAGTSDLNALVYNPAGLAYSETAIQIDATLPLHTTQYQRSLNGQSLPMVEGQGLSIPVPNLGMTFKFKRLPRLRFGINVTGPLPMVQNWPNELEDGSPAPQRYSIQNYAGTAMIKIAAGTAYQLTDWLAIGGAFQMLTGSFSSQVTASTSPTDPPENASYDSTVRMKASGIIAPGAHLGMQLKPASWLRFGFAWESGFYINNKARYDIQMPSAPSFKGAVLTPEQPEGSIRFKLPQTFRVGSEIAFNDRLKVEFDFTWENWSAHNNIHLNFGKTSMHGPLINPYEFTPVDVQRGFQNTYSVRLGTEYTPIILGTRNLTLRAGIMYEPSAIPNQYLTAVSVDMDKLMISGGATYKLNKTFEVEVLYAHIFMADRHITDSAVTQPSLIRPEPANKPPLGNGNYSSRADLFGLGLRVYL